MRARVVAPLVAAVLGIGGGVATALVVAAATTRPPPSTYNDPLHLDIALVDLDCSGRVAAGRRLRRQRRAARHRRVADTKDAGARYLRTDELRATRCMGPEDAATRRRTSSTSAPTTPSASRARAG